VNADPNWRNGGLPDKFFNLDSVTFNNTGAANSTVNITDTVFPGNITVGSTATYTFAGTGRISGGTLLTLNGPGGLVITNSGVNDYVGGTVINGGTLQIGNGGTTGDLGPGPVLNNSSLVFN